MNWPLNTWFENSIYTVILISMLLLVLDNPLNDPNSGFQIVISYCDIIVMVVFGIEVMCRIIALGFYNTCLEGQKAYINSGSNQIDFFVALSCL